MSGLEHTLFALFIKTLTPALLAKTGWLELKSRYLSICVGFLYTKNSISSPLGLENVSKKGITPPCWVALEWTLCVDLWSFGTEALPLFCLWISCWTHHLHIFSIPWWEWGLPDWELDLQNTSYRCWPPLVCMVSPLGLCVAIWRSYLEKWTHSFPVLILVALLLQ